MSRSNKPPVLVSACLIGICTNWQGGHSRVDWIQEAVDQGLLLPVCPEQLGGLPTPRIPVERTGDRVVNSAGEDKTAEMKKGAEETLAIAREAGATVAILKSNSPSCGKGAICDGSFSGTLVEGDGVTTELLLANGITVVTEKEIRSMADLRALIEKS